ncbi:hypothetical protein V8E54_005548 [Elaphomyces granulatus]
MKLITQLLQLGLQLATIFNYPALATTSFSVTFCTNENFPGHRESIQSTPNNCQMLPLELQKQVTSVRPEQSAGVCTIFADYYCQTSADYGEVTWPGNPDLAGTNPWPNPGGLMNSWSCDGDTAISG